MVVLSDQVARYVRPPFIRTFSRASTANRPPSRSNAACDTCTCPDTPDDSIRLAMVTVSPHMS